MLKLKSLPSGPRLFRYLFLLPLLTMVIFIATFIEMFNANGDALIYEIRTSIRQELNIISDQSLKALGQGAAWILDPATYKSHIVNGVELLDQMDQTYAAAFVHSSDSESANQYGYDMITKRVISPDEADINPFESAEFRDEITKNEHGELTIDDQCVYFRWAPMVSGQPDRYLTVIATSMKGLRSHILDGVKNAVVILVIITSLLNIGLIAILSRGAIPISDKTRHYGGTK